MLKVAIDESGARDSAPVICVVACAASSTQWRHFARSWAPYASKYKHGFHASKASEADKRVLAALIAARVEFGLATTIAFEDFEAVVTPELRSRFGAEYSTAIQAIALVLKGFFDKNRIRWGTWILEAGHRGEASARAFLDRRVRDPAWHILAHKWVGKEELITHAPDLASHEITACFGQKASPLLLKIGESVLHRHFSREELVEAVRKGTEGLRLTTRQREIARARRKRKR